MINRTKEGLIFTILLACLFVSDVGARGNNAFVIEPLGKVSEKVELKVTDRVSGNLSVSNGFIDFYIKDPSGIVLLLHNKTAFNVFNFTAEEDGNYTMHLVNSCQTGNASVALNYSVTFKVDLHLGVDVDHSIGTAIVIEVPPPPPDPDPVFDDPYAKHLNFINAHKVLRIVRGVRNYMPLQNTLLVLGCVALLMALIEITEFVHRRPNKNYVRVMSTR